MDHTCRCILVSLFNTFIGCKYPWKFVLNRFFVLSSGMTAPQAAGVIHSDFEKGFIRAETVRVSSFFFYYLAMLLFI